MKTRIDTVFVACVLFTVALSIPVPKCVEAAWNRNDLIFQAGGFMALSNIVVGLTVVWTEFRRRNRWAWLVMFIIVWLGAFPALVLPLLQHTIGPGFSEWISDALWNWGFARVWTISVLVFLMMLLALVLPIKSFLGTRKEAHSTL